MEYAGKKDEIILVTGGAGFIGSHIVDKFLDMDYKVIVVDNLSTGKYENLPPRAGFYKMDIRDPELEEVFRKNKINYVCHQAAQASVSKSIENPDYDASINILGTINLLKLCKKYNVKKLIAASSAAIYGNPQYLPINENYEAEVLSFYGLSKLAMEHYIKLSGIDHIIFRYSNVYGPRQDSDGEAGVISIFIDKILKNQPLKIFGAGQQTRDFVYVKDIAIANFLAVESNIKNETINLSTNISKSLLELVDYLHNISKTDINIQYDQPRSGDIEHSLLDNSKATTLLKWSNTVSLYQGLYQTLEWKKRSENYSLSV